MANLFPGETPFAIDGTGRVIRPGDDVIVYPRRALFVSAGPGVLTAIGAKLVTVAFPSGEPGLCHPAEICRADDHERTSAGDPLWTWM